MHLKSIVMKGMIAGIMGLALMVSAQAQDSVLTFAHYCSAATQYSTEPRAIMQLPDGTYWLAGTDGYFAKADTSGKFLELYRVLYLPGANGIYRFFGNWWFAMNTDNGDISVGKVGPAGVDTLFQRKYLYLPTNRYFLPRDVVYTPGQNRIYVVGTVRNSTGYQRALLVLDTLGEVIRFWMYIVDGGLPGKGDAIAMARDGDLLIDWLGDGGHVIVKLDPQTGIVRWARKIVHESEGAIIQDPQTSYIWVALSGWNPFVVFVFDENGGLVAQGGMEKWTLGDIPAKPIIFRNNVVIPIVSPPTAQTGLFYFDRTTGTLVSNIIPVIGARNGGLWQNPAQVILTRDSGLAMVARDANGRLVILKTNLYGEMSGCPWVGTDTLNSVQPPSITLVNVTLEDSTTNLKPDTLYFTQIDQYLVLDSVDCPPTMVSNSEPTGVEDVFVHQGDLLMVMLLGDGWWVVPRYSGVRLTLYSLEGKEVYHALLTEPTWIRLSQANVMIGLAEYQNQRQRFKLFSLNR